MYCYVSIYSEECFWTQYMYRKLIPFNRYRWCPLGKLSHLGLEQLYSGWADVHEYFDGKTTTIIMSLSRLSITWFITVYEIGGNNYYRLFSIYLSILFLRFPANRYRILWLKFVIYWTKIIPPTNRNSYPPSIIAKKISKKFLLLGVKEKLC